MDTPGAFFGLVTFICKVKHDTSFLLSSSASEMSHNINRERDEPDFVALWGPRSGTLSVRRYDILSSKLVDLPVIFGARHLIFHFSWKCKTESIRWLCLSCFARLHSREVFFDFELIFFDDCRVLRSFLLV